MGVGVKSPKLKRRVRRAAARLAIKPENADPRVIKARQRDMKRALRGGGLNG